MTIVITITSVNVVKMVMYYMGALTFQYTLLWRGCQCSSKKGTPSDCCGLVGAESDWGLSLWSLDGSVCVGSLTLGGVGCWAFELVLASVMFVVAASLNFRTCSIFQLVCIYSSSSINLDRVILWWWTLSRQLKWLDQQLYAQHFGGAIFIIHESNFNVD